MCIGYMKYNTQHKPLEHPQILVSAEVLESTHWKTTGPCSRESALLRGRPSCAPSLTPASGQCSLLTPASGQCWEQSCLTSFPSVFYPCPLGSCPNLPVPPPFFRHYPSLGKISTEYQTTSPLPPTQIVISESLLASGQIFTHPYPFLEAMSTQGPKALLRSSVPAAHLLEPNPYPLLHVPYKPLGSGSRY